MAAAAEAARVAAAEVAAEVAALEARRAAMTDEISRLVVQRQALRNTAEQ